jgi:hypothetical protein
MQIISVPEMKEIKRKKVNTREYHQPRDALERFGDHAGPLSAAVAFETVCAVAKSKEKNERPSG